MKLDCSICLQEVCFSVHILKKKVQTEKQDSQVCIIIIDDFIHVELLPASSANNLL